MMKVVESFYAITQGVEPLPGAGWSLEDLSAKSALAAVAHGVDADNCRVLADVLGEIIYECRAALEYADNDAPASRLARRVVAALMPIAPGREGSRLEPPPYEEPHVQ